LRIAAIECAEITVTAINDAEYASPAYASIHGAQVAVIASNANAWISASRNCIVNTLPVQRIAIIIGADVPIFAVLRREEAARGRMASVERAEVAIIANFRNVYYHTIDAHINSAGIPVIAIYRV